MNELMQPALVSAFRAVGVSPGRMVFVHSALSSLGRVHGGAPTVVAALVEALGATGTLVAPTFTFAHGQTEEPIFDPQRDRSEMGIISETVRTWPGAQRSCHLLHSVAAVGAQAHELTAVHGPSAWAADGPFWQFYSQNATILLLGVPYLRCTFFHMLEQLVQVPYRQWVEKGARRRTAGGQEESLPTLIYRPKPGFSGNDFNKFGAMLEERGVVQIGAVGNAMARCFSASDALTLGLAAYRHDPLLFVKTTTHYTPLRDGVMTPELYKEKCVVNPALIVGKDDKITGGDHFMPQSTLRCLTDDQVLQFKLNGFLIVEDVLTAAEVTALATHCDLIAAGKVAHIPETSIQLEKVFREGELPVTDQVLAVRKLFNIAVYDEVMWRHVVNPKIVDIIADLLGTDDLKLYGDQLFMKAPQIGAEQPWHQDSASWRDIFPMDLVTAWTAIDHATLENGCLNFAPGTHRWGMMRANQLTWFLGDLGSKQWPIMAALLRPGSISFHHSLVLHQSNANRSAQRRRGYAVHYMRATSRRDEAVTDAPKMPPFQQVCGRSFPGCV